MAPRHPWLSRGLVVLAAALAANSLLAVAWRRASAVPVPSTSRRRDRRAAAGLALLAAFTVGRYAPAAGGVLAGAPLPAEFAQDPAMYWTIVLLDLGVVVPLTLAVAAGLLGGADWARRACYGVAGWYVLVPVSVAAMGAAMLLADDPHARLGTVVVLAVAAALFTGFAAWVWRPLLDPPKGVTPRAPRG